MTHEASRPRAFLRASILGLLVVAGALTGACAVDTGEEDVDATEEALAQSRCAGVSAKETTTIKVMTINLRHDADDWRHRFDLIADEIARLKPDIIGLQEVEVRQDQTDTLRRLITKRSPLKYDSHTKRKPGLKGYLTGEGIAILSRWPIVEKHDENIGEIRVSAWVRIAHPLGPIDMVNTHLTNGGGPERDADRDDEVKETLEHLVNRHGACHPTLFTGDLNARDNAPAVKRILRAGFKDSFRAVHGDATSRIGNTGPIKLEKGAKQRLSHRIDYVFGRGAGPRTLKPLTSEVCFENHDAEGFYPSDHLGVMTTYAVTL